MSHQEEGSDLPEKPTLADVFRTEEGPLLRFAYGLLGRREVAEEIVQEAFLALHSHWDEVRNPRAWLYKCTRNRSYNYLRDHKREHLTDEQDGTESEPREAPDEILGRMEAAGQVRLLLSELAHRDQEIVRLKFDDELTYMQISKQLEMTVGNVGYRLHHILKSLAEGLRRVGVDKI